MSEIKNDYPTKRCTGRSRAGNICNQPIAEHEPWCVWHDPSREADRRAAASKLGKAGRAKQIEARQNTKEKNEELSLLASLDTAATIRTILEYEIKEVRDKIKDPSKRANAIARLTAVALQSMRVTDNDQEMEKMREQMKQMASSEGKEIELVWPDTKKPDEVQKPNLKLAE